VNPRSRNTTEQSRPGTLAFVALALIFVASAAGTSGEGGDALGEVRRVLLQNAQGFEAGDFPLLDSIWAHDESVTVFESGYANYGWEDYRDRHLKPEVEEMKNVKYELSDIKPAVDGKTAVSYTHLDVYKRQRYSLSSFSFSTRD